MVEPRDPDPRDRSTAAPGIWRDPVTGEESLIEKDWRPDFEERIAGLIGTSLWMIVLYMALGALAAGAAHELGTPLATIAVIVGELERDAFQNSEVHADLALVREQVGICKGIISSLAARAGTLRPERVQVQDAGVWLRDVCSRWQTMRPGTSCRLTLAGQTPTPRIVTEATLEQALTNLLNNAADASDTEIGIKAENRRERAFISGYHTGHEP